MKYFFVELFKVFDRTYTIFLSMGHTIEHGL